MPPLLTIAHLTPALFASELSARGWKLGRAPELLRALYAKAGNGKPLDLTRFGGPAHWAGTLPDGPTTVLQTHTAADGTRKLLVACHDTPRAADTVECVLMPTDRPGRVAACVSSQVGCAMACAFCASGLHGLTRNLTAAEIVGQYLHLRALACSDGKRLANLVFMGMGEPLHNYDNVLAAIHRISSPDCAAFGYKNIQLSTVGIVPAIHKLTASGVRIQLALSLHGPDDATRSAIVPAGQKYTVEATLGAAYAHQEATGRISNIEYCLLAGVNDSPAQARALAAALAGRRMHVNLIPHNAIGAVGSGLRAYARPTLEAQHRFLDELRAQGVVTHLRKTRGDDQAAACGQLRRVALTLS